MKNNIWKLLLLSLLIIYSYDFFAQNVIIKLDIKNVNKNKLSFPCKSINDCIDSIYKNNDTLFILLQDTRKFYQDDNIIAIFSNGYKISKRDVNVLISEELISDFIILKTFDFFCIFEKHKKKKETYNSILIEEIVDYSNKKNIDLKDTCSVGFKIRI